MDGAQAGGIVLSRILAHGLVGIDQEPARAEIVRRGTGLGLAEAHVHLIADGHDGGIDALLRERREPVVHPVVDGLPQLCLGIGLPGGGADVVMRAGGGEHVVVRLHREEYLQSLRPGLLRIGEDAVPALPVYIYPAVGAEGDLVQLEADAVGAVGLQGCIRILGRAVLAVHQAEVLHEGSEAHRAALVEQVEAGSLVRYHRRYRTRLGPGVVARLDAGCQERKGQKDDKRESESFHNAMTADANGPMVTEAALTLTTPLETRTLPDLDELSSLTWVVITLSPKLWTTSTDCPS